MKEEEVGSLAMSLFNINDKFTNEYYQSLFLSVIPSIKITRHCIFF